MKFKRLCCVSPSRGCIDRTPRNSAASAEFLLRAGAILLALCLPVGCNNSDPDESEDAAEGGDGGGGGGEAGGAGGADNGNDSESSDGTSGSGGDAAGRSGSNQDGGSTGGGGTGTNTGATGGVSGSAGRAGGTSGVAGGKAGTSGAGGGTGGAAGSTPVPMPAVGRLRMIIETDAPGGDPDDEGSLVRFLMYANEWDIEGILATRKASQSRTGVDGKQTVLGFIGAYAKTYASLKQHKSDYPAPETLSAVTKASFNGNEARDHVIAVVDKNDPRPVWYVNWGTNDGNLTGMRLALDHVKSTRSAADYKRFMSKIHFSRDADRPYHVAEHIPNIAFWVDTRDPDRWYHRWEPLTKTAGGFDINRDVKNNHGPLGSLYTIQKEGDSPGFMYLLDVGLSDPLHPTWGSWGGRFAPRTDAHAKNNPGGFFWSSAEDTYAGSTNRDNTLKRWAVHVQNDFRARMDWAVSGPSGANHEPKPLLNGVSGLRAVEFPVAAGDTVKLSADGSSDPDGNKLSYEWVYYPEAGSYKGSVAIAGESSANATVNVPSNVESGDTIHVVLVVTDDGSPALTRYRRAVIRVR